MLCKFFLWPHGMGCKHGHIMRHKPLHHGDNYSSMISRIRCALNWRVAQWGGWRGEGLVKGEWTVGDTDSFFLDKHTLKHAHTHTNTHTRTLTHAGARAHTHTHTHTHIQYMTGSQAPYTCQHQMCIDLECLKRAL